MKLKVYLNRQGRPTYRVVENNRVLFESTTSYVAMQWAIDHLKEFNPSER